MTVLTKYVSQFRRGKSYAPNDNDTEYFEVGEFSDRISQMWVQLTDNFYDEIPAGSHIDQAYLVLKKISGGYNPTMQFYTYFITESSISALTPNNPGTNRGYPWGSYSIYGVNSGELWVTMTAAVQECVDHDVESKCLHIRPVDMYFNTDDGKQFSTTPGDHYLWIQYTAPPTEASNVTATRVSDTRIDLAWTAATGQTSYGILRRTDGGAWVQIASGISSAATSWSDTSATGNHRYEYSVRSDNSAGSAYSDASNIAYTTPAALTSVTATKTGTTEVTLAWTGTINSEEYFEVESSTDGGSNWSPVEDQVAQDATGYVDASAPAGTVKYRVRAYRGSLYSAWVESNTVTTLCAPAAPTLLNVWGTYKPTGATLRIEWQHNTIDGSAQTGAYIYWEINGTPDNDTVSSSQAYYDIDISGCDPADVIEAKVKTKGLHVDYGPYSDLESTTLATPPTATIDNPSADLEEVTDLPLVVGWTYTNDFAQAGWTLKLFKDGVRLQTWTGTTEDEQSITGAYLENGETYSLQLQVRSGAGMLSSWVVRTFVTNYTPPTEPSFAATFDPEGLLVSVIAVAGETGTNPETDHLVLVRIDEFEGRATTEVIEEDLPQSTYYDDPLPRLGTDVTYQVWAVAANGAFSYAELVVDTRGSGSGALNYGDGYTSVVPLKWDGREKRSTRDNSERYSFTGRSKPVLFSGRQRLDMVSASATLLDDSDRAAVESLRDWHQKCVYRSAFGFRDYVQVEQVDDNRDAEDEDTESGISVGMAVVE